MSHKFSLKIMAVIIHPMWLIEEKANSFRKEVWFKPPMAPIKVDIRIKIRNKLFMLIKYEIIIIGANFCQVIKIMLLYHEIFSITLGNQKWKGAAPNFIIKVITINFIGNKKLNIFK